MLKMAWIMRNKCINRKKFRPIIPVFEFWILILSYFTGTLRADAEALETTACNNKADLDLIPDELFSVARRIGVSPEMILDHVGKDVLFSRELERDHLKVAPNGLIIPLKVSLLGY